MLVIDLINNHLENLTLFRLYLEAEIILDVTLQLPYVFNVEMILLVKQNPVRC